MAASMEQLQGFAKELGFTSEMVEGQKYLAVQVPVDALDGKEIVVLTRTYDNGEMFEAVMVQFIDTEQHQKSDHKLEFLFYLLHQAWNTKFGTPEVDKDGEVRLLVEIPLVDAEMTVRQFERIVRTITADAIQIAVEGGKVLEGGMAALESEDEEEKIRRVMGEMIPSLMRMATSEEGRVHLQQLVDDSGTPEVVRKTAAMILSATGGDSSDVPDTI